MGLIREIFASRMAEMAKGDEKPTGFITVGHGEEAKHVPIFGGKKSESGKIVGGRLGGDPPLHVMEKIHGNVKDPEKKKAWAERIEKHKSGSAPEATSEPFVPNSDLHYPINRDELVDEALKMHPSQVEASPRHAVALRDYAAHQTLDYGEMRKLRGLEPEFMHALIGKHTAKDLEIARNAKPELPDYTPASDSFKDLFVQNHLRTKMHSAGMTPDVHKAFDATLRQTGFKAHDSVEHGGTLGRIAMAHAYEPAQIVHDRIGKELTSDALRSNDAAHLGHVESLLEHMNHPGVEQVHSHRQQVLAKEREAAQAPIRNAAALEPFDATKAPKYGLLKATGYGHEKGFHAAQDGNNYFSDNTHVTRFEDILPELRANALKALDDGAGVNAKRPDYVEPYGDMWGSFMREQAEKPNSPARILGVDPESGHAHLLLHNDKVVSAKADKLATQMKLVGANELRHSGKDNDPLHLYRGKEHVGIVSLVNQNHGNKKLGPTAFHSNVDVGAALARDLKHKLPDAKGFTRSGLSATDEKINRAGGIKPTDAVLPENRADQRYAGNSIIRKHAEAQIAAAPHRQDAIDAVKSKLWEGEHSSISGKELHDILDHLENVAKMSDSDIVAKKHLNLPERFGHDAALSRVKGISTPATFSPAKSQVQSVKDGMKAVSHAIADDDSRYGLNGAYLEADDSGARWVSTNGSQLSLAPVDKAEAMAYLKQKGVKSPDAHGRYHALIHVTGRKATSGPRGKSAIEPESVLDNDFPDYRQVYSPYPAHQEATVDAQALHAMAKHAIPTHRGRQFAQITLSAKPDGNLYASVPLRDSGESHTVMVGKAPSHWDPSDHQSFDARLLEPVLRGKTGGVKIGLGRSSRAGTFNHDPAVFRHENGAHDVLMPVRTA